MAFVPIYILILAFTIIVDYVAGIYIDKSSGKRRKYYLVLSLIANIGVLAIFKYYNFINENLSFLTQTLGIFNPLPAMSIILPIGLSFHTFQAMSYTIEVYRGNQRAEKHLGLYSLYVMFYPQLVAGPIERPQNLLHQFRTKYNFDYDRVTSGLKLMVWGLFKKVMIADRLAVVVDTVYGDPTHYNGLSLGIATVFFAFQIFCDFSGYSDMAIGAARVMGFKLMKNFEMPYHSKSVNEFWKRWHISLSTWFRDYLYISLGGNRVTIPRWYLNLFIVFLVSGLWHGANWTFVVWGALHGFFIVFANITKGIRQKINSVFHFDRISIVPIIITFSLVSIAWVFFRADDVQTAVYIVKHIVIGIPEIFSNLFSILLFYEPMGVPKREIAFSVLLICFMEGVHYIQRKRNFTKLFSSLPGVIRWSAYIITIITILKYGVFESKQFIYFQF